MYNCSCCAFGGKAVDFGHYMDSRPGRYREYRVYLYMSMSWGAFIRKVLHCCPNQPWAFHQSVIQCDKKLPSKVAEFKCCNTRSTEGQGNWHSRQTNRILAEHRRCRIEGSQRGCELLTCDTQINGLAVSLWRNILPRSIFLPLLQVSKAGVPALDCVKGLGNHQDTSALKWYIRPNPSCRTT